MSFLESLFTWANAPFTSALGVAVGFAALQMSGALGLFAGGHDGDADGHDTDADVDGHDADADGHDADGHDGDDADGEDGDDADDEESHTGAGFASSLGVGKVPLSIVWQTYAVSFAVTGIVLNAVRGSFAASTLVWTVPVALLTGYGVTRALSGALARLVANPEQEATTRRELVGQTGTVISTKVDSHFGEIRLRDKTGHTLRIVCTTRDASIPAGREVVVVDYDREGDHLFVSPLDDVYSRLDPSGVDTLRGRRTP